MTLNEFRKKISRKIYHINDNPLRQGKNENFVFIHINKTGGTSIARAVGLQQKRHLTVKEVIDIIGYRNWETAYSFAFVRNPWAKVFSHYKYRVATNQNQMKLKPIDFLDWVKITYGDSKDTFYYDKPKMFMTQSEWLKDFDEKISLNFIGKLENIENDFIIIADKIGILNKLPHLNKSHSSNYTKHYNDECADIIANWYDEDIKRFKYNYDG